MHGVGGNDVKKCVETCPISLDKSDKNVDVATTKSARVPSLDYLSETC